MCREDWSFVAENGRFIDWETDDMAAMAASWTKFRHQKNPKLHGVKIDFANQKNKEHCSNHAKLRILQRHKRLGMDPSVPLAVYRKQKGCKKGSFFTKRGVEENWTHS